MYLNGENRLSPRHALALAIVSTIAPFHWWMVAVSRSGSAAFTQLPPESDSFWSASGHADLSKVWPLLYDSTNRLVEEE